MSTARLELALERLKPSNWELFERLASSFLASEFSNLRTVAWPAGDKGRDAQLWSPQDEPSVMMQYSVTDDWKGKIRSTAKGLREEFPIPAANLLIYLTNQALNPSAVDDLRAEVRKTHRIHLDVRDRRWFLERWEKTPMTVSASIEICKAIVDPYLASRGLYESKAQALTEYESRVSFVYLALQLEDDTREKGLTRLCFEAMVRAVLRDTNSESRIRRSEVHERIASLLPGHDLALVIRHADSALKSLTKRHIRHWQQIDEFCLTHDEATRVHERLAQFERQDACLAGEITEAVQLSAKHLKVSLPADFSPVCSRVRRLLEKALALRGESFATAAVNGAACVPEDELASLLDKDAASNPETGRQGGALLAVARSAAEALLVSPSPGVHAYLRSLVDAYTLTAFLRQTPDVQSVISKMFSDGELWLDANTVLPLLAETLCPEEARQFTVLVKAAVEAGLSLAMTPGILEEVERNINRAKVYASRSDGWHGHIPFLYSAFTWSRQGGSFSEWAGQFAGPNRPEDDLATYLSEEFGIKIRPLEDDATKAAPRMREAAAEYWRRVHEARRDQANLDAMTIDRLIDHDVENCLGVIQRRGNDRDGAFGYRTWWLTLDHAAHRCMNAVCKEIGQQSAIVGPALSPDFLNAYLAVGPARRALSRETEHLLPLMLDLSVMEIVPSEFVQATEAAREQLRKLPDRVRRRRIRDTLDLMRRKAGPLAQAGASGMMETIKRVLVNGG
jgi:hypothetical protein